MLTVPSLLDIANKAATEVGGVEIFITGDAMRGATPFWELIAAARTAMEDAASPDLTAMLPFSSGTTGLPKPVELTHRALVAAALQAGTTFGFLLQDSLLALAPFFFIAGSVVVLLGGLVAGASIVVVPCFQFETLVDVLERHRVSAALFVPPIMKMLAERGEVEGRDLSQMRFVLCGGSSVSAEIEEAVARRLGTIVLQAYGTTETCAMIAGNSVGAARPGTCGKPFPLSEIRIVDLATGADNGPNETGEIWVRGPQLMKGYFDDAGATGEVLSADGWLRTGDLGLFDTDGYLHLSGRLKELIKVNANQVSPAELEALIATHPAVADVAVIGRRDEKTGERPVAYIVARTEMRADDLMDWVTARVARYKRICAVHFVDQIPRSPAGKILRRLLL